jgi:hypothetical protein
MTKKYMPEPEVIEGPPIHQQMEEDKEARRQQDIRIAWDDANRDMESVESEHEDRERYERGERPADV